MMAADGAAGLGISEKMRGLIRGLAQAGHNVADGISIVPVADAGLGSILEPPLQRMRELAIQAASDTNTDQDRQAIQQEVEQIKKAIDGIATSTNFNGIYMLDQTRHPEFWINKPPDPYANCLVPLTSVGAYTWGYFDFATDKGYATTTADNNIALVDSNGGGSSSLLLIDGIPYDFHGRSFDGIIDIKYYSSGPGNDVFVTYAIHDPAWLADPTKDIRITQRIRIVQDKYEISYSVQNNDTVAHNIGVLHNIDPTLGDDRFVPFEVDGAKVVDSTTYTGASIPTTVEMYDPTVEDKVEAQAVFKGAGIIEPPDKVVLGTLDAENWSYTTDGTPIIGGYSYSAIWNPRSVSSGGGFTVNTFYGLTMPPTITKPPDPIYQLALQVGANAAIQKITDWRRNTGRSKTPWSTLPLMSPMPGKTLAPPNRGSVTPTWPARLLLCLRSGSSPRPAKLCWRKPTMYPNSTF